MVAAKKISDYVPPLKQQGMEFLAAAPVGGVCVQAAQVTQSGVAPLVVTFSSSGPLYPMENDDYVVLTGGETAAATSVDQSTITVNGFNVLGGADTEVIHIVVIGRLRGQAG